MFREKFLSLVKPAPQQPQPAEVTPQSANLPINEQSFSMNRPAPAIVEIWHGKDIPGDLERPSSDFATAVRLLEALINAGLPEQLAKEALERRGLVVERREMTAFVAPDKKGLLGQIQKSPDRVVAYTNGVTSQITALPGSFRQQDALVRVERSLTRRSEEDRIRVIKISALSRKIVKEFPVASETQQTLDRQDRLKKMIEDAPFILEKAA